MWSEEWALLNWASLWEDNFVTGNKTRKTNMTQMATLRTSQFATSLFQHGLFLVPNFSHEKTDL